jgi:hypothetical protein
MAGDTKYRMKTLFQNGDYPPLRRWSDSAQILVFALFCFLLYTAAGMVLATFHIHSTVGQWLADISGIRFLALFLEMIFYPFLFTLFTQWLPMVLIRWTKKPVNIQMLFAGAWFALFHIKFGPVEMIQKFFVGWVLAACFVFCRKESFKKAFLVTSLSHSLFNIFFLLYFLLIHYVTASR